jgi:hypothetical protein
MMLLISPGREYIKKTYFPSPYTVNMRVIEYGEKIQEMNTEKIKNACIEIAFADGTKIHSQEKGLSNDDLKKRINMTVDDLKKMSKELWKLGCRKTAKFIKEYSNSMVVFATFAMNGIIVPWNSNIIERLMGEISKRTKHKWMKWTTKGLETILNIILVRYCSEENYEEFKNRIMVSENLIFIMAEVKICLIRGEF